jgi:phospholipid/cholesterol/gamma-HCH transport system permease protein
MSDPNPIVFRGGIAGWPAKVGLAAYALLSCLELYFGILAGKSRLDLPAFAGALRQSGLSMLPAITLVSAIVGIILGDRTSAVLMRLDLPGLVLLTIAYSVIMELIPILVGILVAGRAGVSLAVRQATLVVSGEMDGLLVTGNNPTQLTLGPALLAMLLMSFSFAVWGTLVTFASAILWLWSIAGVAPSLFLDALKRALTPGDIMEALGKPPLFALAIALIATVNGTLAGRDPAGIGRAATGTMIGAVTAILLVDLLFVLLR